MSEETTQVMTTQPATESTAPAATPEPTKDTPDSAPVVEAKAESPEATEKSDAKSDPLPSPSAPVDTIEARMRAICDRVHVTMDELDAAGMALHRQGLSDEQIWRRLEHEGAAEIRHLAQMSRAPRAESEDGDLVAVEVVRGTFHGGKCPDKHARKFKQDQDFDYDEHHPAAPGEIVLVSQSEAARLLKLPGGAFKKHQPKGS